MGLCIVASGLPVYLVFIHLKQRPAWCIAAARSALTYLIVFLNIICAQIKMQLIRVEYLSLFSIF